MVPEPENLPWSGSRLMRHLARGASVALLTQVGFALLAFGNGVVLARFLGASGYGAFNNAMAWINIAIMPATLGFSVLLIRQVAVYRASARWGLLNALRAYADRRVLLFSLLVLLAVALLSMLLYRGDDALIMRHTLWMALPLLPLMAISRLREGTLRGWEALAQAQIPGMIVRPVLLLTGLVSVGWLLSEQMTPMLAIALNLAATVCALLLLLVWTRRLMPTVPPTPVDAGFRRAWLLAAVPMMIAGNMQVLLTQTDILVLGVVTGAQETGVYSAAARLAYLLFYGNAIADLVLAPVIARLYAQQQMRELQPLLTRVVRLSLLLMLPVGMVIVFAREPLLGIFGAEFRSGGGLVVVLVIGRLLEVALGSGALVLTMTGNEALMARIFAIAAVVNIVLNLVLVPMFGALGAAAATLLSVVGAKLAFAVAAQRKCGVRVTILGSRL